MKKINYLALVLFSTCIMACSKDRECNEPAPKNMAELAKMILNDKNCPYNSEVKVSDATGKYFVRYRISSHDESMVKAMVNELEGATLDLFTEKPVTDPSSSKPAGEEPKLIPAEIKRTVHLVELEHQIGNFAGYGLGMSAQQSKINGYANSYSYINLTIYGTGGFFVQNLWVNPNTNYHSYVSQTTGFWVGDETRTLAFGEYYAFTGGGYTDHSILSIPSEINGTFTYNNRIYWSSYP